MLKQSFSLGSITMLGGMVLGSVAWSAGCSSDDPPAGTGTGTDAGSSGTTDSGASSSGDTGASSSGDSGGDQDTGVKQGVTITYGKCDPFTKCASDPVGSWTVSGGCLSEDTFAEAKVKCPGLKESNVVIKASGTVSVTAANLTRNSTTSLSASVLVPKSCAGGFNCAAIAAGLMSGALPGIPTFDSATCADAGTNCNCDVTSTLTESSNDTYTSAKDGDLTTTGAKGDRTFEYCVQGNKITYLETTAQSLPFLVEMTK